MSNEKIGVIGNLPRGINITSSNGVVVIPEDSTAEEIRQAVSVQAINNAPPKEMVVTINSYQDKMSIANSKFYNTIIEGELRGKSHLKKPHKPNTGFKLRSYKYKSKRK